MLKSLELFGFKSFVDRTRFDFAPGITGIVGPNGSGKSNVVDAIKWILGDQSPKSMRGKEMTDVIFNGSPGRKSSGFAEATLTFDNTSKILPIEAGEIQIGRRIWQNGDSEYLINGGASRLKDIRDLFLGTGSSAYSIIEQGRVAAILQSNTTNRRLVFEEAAGISRYKSRKTQALRKLERVGQNLLRLTDIVDEVEAQLTSTRNQAQKAAKYREVTGELRQWWLGLAADDHREHASRLEELDRIVDDFRDQLVELEALKQASERGLAEIDNEINRAEERIRGIERLRSHDREKIAAFEATVGHQRSRGEELDRDCLQLIAIVSRLQHRKRQAVDQQGHSQVELDEFDEQLTSAIDLRQAAQHALDQVNEQLEADRSRLETLRRTQLEQARIVASCNEKVQALKSRLGALEVEQTETRGQLERLSSQASTCQQEYEQRQTRVAEATRDLEAVDDSVARARQARDRLLEQQDEFVKELSATRERRSAHQARIAVLEKLERRQEGVGLGVREILDRAKTSQQAPWNLIRGSVTDLIQVDLEHAPLVDVALGDAAQWIVLEEIDPLGKYLLEHSGKLSDRVGFLAADAPVSSNQASERDLSDQPGVVGPVAAGVQTDQGSEWLIARLLDDTWVVNSLGDALRLARGPGRGARFVTQQGELIERDGTLLAGPLSTEASPLSRKSELRRLRQELADLQNQIETSQLQLGDLDESLVSSECDLTAADSQRESILDRLVRLKSDAEDQRRELEAVIRERGTVEDELQQIDESQRCSRQELDTTIQEHDTSEQRQQQLGSQAESIQARQEERRRQRTEQEDSLGQTRLEATRQEERRANLRDVCKHRRSEVEHHAEQALEASRRLTHISSQQQDIDLEILNVSSQLAELAITDEHHDREIVQLVTIRNELRQQRTELAVEDNRLSEDGQNLRQQQHDEELKTSEIRAQFDSVEQRLQDEYQLGLDDLVDSDASAFQLYLAELLVPDESDEPGEDQLATDEQQMDAASGNPEHEDGPDGANGLEADQEHGDDGRDGAGNSTTGSAGEPAADVDPVRLQPPPGVTFLSVRDQLENRVARLRRKLKLMGSVNTAALESLDEFETRFEHLENQRRDLAEAKATLEEIVQRINEESQRLFHKSFTTIQGHFREMFRKLFGGGEGDIILEDPDDVLDCSIEIVARPPGKELRSLSLLSGGEKTLTAVALVMAIFKSNPSPFCILDEVDAALDDANIGRYTTMLGDFDQTTQFIMITHRKPTMTIADLIYGVTMEQPGISKRISVRFEDVNEDGDFTSNSPDGESDAA
ncbi:MAG: chromosome segregation protein SMC [Planctomycetaceae bacterium]|nr:chromosome segregation protein SMC [Planctomycetaceae bacterium]